MGNEKWFGRTFETVGTIEKDFLIKTRGQIKILYNKQFIDIVKDGKLNVENISILKKVKDASEINGDGIYLCEEDGSIYIVIDGNKILITDGSDSTYVSYLVKQNTSSDLKFIALNNIGLVFNSLYEALDVIIDGFVYIIDEEAFYTVSNGTFTKLKFEIPNPYPKLFVIKREDNGSGGALKLEGTGKENGITIANSTSIYDYSNNTIINNNGGKVIISIGDKNILTIDRNGVTSVTNIITLKDFIGDNIHSDNFLEGLTGYRLYYDSKTGKSILEVDKVIERDANNLNKEIRTYSDGSIISSIEGDDDLEGVFYINATPYMELVKGDLIEILPFANVLLEEDFTVTLKIPIRFYVEDVEDYKAKITLYSDDVLEFQQIGEDTVIIYHSEELGDLTLSEFELPGSLESASVYKVAKLGDPEDESTWLETICTDYLNRTISVQKNYIDSSKELHINAHVILGNLEPYEVINEEEPRPEFRQGLFSDNPIFNGVIFREPIESEELEVINFPRYSNTLNTDLCENHKEVEEEDPFENVIPTIKWIKKNSLNHPLKDINEAELPENPDADHSAIVWKNGKWQYVKIPSIEDLERLRNAIDELSSRIEECCGAIPEADTRWVGTGDYTCKDFNKVEIEKEQVSYDGGVVWIDTGQTRKEKIIEKDSIDCGYVMYLWVYEDYTCEEDFSKWELERKQISYDKGLTWENTEETRKGELIEENSTDCGYIETFTVSYYVNEDDSEPFYTYTIESGEIATLPEESPIKKHYKFLGWDYDNSPITKDTKIYAEWLYINPMVNLSSNIQTIPATGGLVTISYFVNWDNERVTDGITLTGTYSNIKIISLGELKVDSDKCSRTLTIGPNNTASKGQLSFKATFTGELDDIHYSELFIILLAAEQTENPEFDIMILCPEYCTTTDSIPKLHFQYGHEDEYKWEDNIFYHYEDEDWVLWEYLGYTDWAFKKNDTGTYDVYYNDGSGWRRSPNPDLMPGLYTANTGILLSEDKYLDGLRGGFSGLSGEDDNPLSTDVTTTSSSIIIRKDYFLLFNSKGEQYVIDRTDPSTLYKVPEDKIYAFNALNYISGRWSRSQQVSMECSANFYKIIKDMPNPNNDIIIYIATSTRNTGLSLYKVSYRLYKLTDPDKGLISGVRQGSYNPEDESVQEVPTNNDFIVGCKTGNKNEIIATIHYDSTTRKITLYSGEVSLEELLESSENSGEIEFT